MEEHFIGADPDTTRVILPTCPPPPVPRRNNIEPYQGADYQRRIIASQAGQSPHQPKQPFKWTVQAFDPMSTFRSSRVSPGTSATPRSPHNDATHTSSSSSDLDISPRPNSDPCYSPRPKSTAGHTPRRPTDNSNEIQHDVLSLSLPLSVEKEQTEKPASSRKKVRKHKHKNHRRLPSKAHRHTCEEKQKSQSDPLPIIHPLEGLQEKPLDSKSTSSSSLPKIRTSSSCTSISSHKSHRLTLSPIWTNLLSPRSNSQTTLPSTPSPGSGMSKELHAYQEELFSTLLKAVTTSQPSQVSVEIHRQGLSSSSSSSDTIPRHSPELDFHQSILPRIKFLAGMTIGWPLPDKEECSVWLMQLRKDINRASRSKSLFELQCILKNITPATAKLILKAIDKDKVKNLQKSFYFYKYPTNEAEQKRIESLGKIKLDTGAVRSLITDGTCTFDTIFISNWEGRSVAFNPSQKIRLDEAGERKVIKEFVEILKEYGHRAGEWGDNAEAALDREAESIHHNEESICSNALRAISVGAFGPARVLLQNFIKIKDTPPYGLSKGGGICRSELHIEDAATFVATIPKTLSITRDGTPIAHIDMRWTVSWSEMTDLTKGNLGVLLRFTKDITKKEKRTIERDWKKGPKLRSEEQIALGETEQKESSSTPSSSQLTASSS